MPKSTTKIQNRGYKTPGKNKYTAAQVIDAILKSEGNLSQAARLLNCERRTVHSYVERFPTVKEAYDDAREGFIDLAESQLNRAVRNGSIPAIIFVLKTIGRHRGYGDHQTVEHKVKIEWDWKIPRQEGEVIEAEVTEVRRLERGE